MQLVTRVALILFATLPNPLFAQQPAVDGIFDEWQAVNHLATDPAGDGVGAFDVSAVSASSSGSVLHLHFDIGQSVNLQNGPEDEGTLQLILGGNQKKLTIDFRARTVTDGSAEHIGWDKVGFQCLPTFASNQYEMRIDVGALGVKSGDTVSLQFAGSDALDQPVEIVLQDADPFPGTKQSWAKPDGIFRVVNQNTLHNGLADPERGPKFKKLFAAINADAYCLQEEWNDDLFNTGAVNTLGTMTVHWHSACAIASPHKLVGLPMVLDRAAAGLVTTDDGRNVVVISAHFKCCGFAGSQEDGLRVQQAEQLVGEFERLREGVFGEEAKNAPVVLIGDYNLVGSREPLDIIKAAGLREVICTAADGTTHTWRGLKSDESFWPGRLDLASISGLRSVNGRVFDTGRLSEAELQQLGVVKDDSTASDHLMLVVDCKLK